MRYDRLPELAFEPLGRGLDEPGASADEEGVRISRTLDRVAPEPVGELGAPAQVGALERRRLLRIRRAGDEFEVPMTEELGESPIDLLVPFVRGDELLRADRLCGADRVERRGEDRPPASLAQPRD